MSYKSKSGSRINTSDGSQDYIFGRKSTEPRQIISDVQLNQLFSQEVQAIQ